MKMIEKDSTNYNEFISDITNASRLSIWVGSETGYRDISIKEAAILSEQYLLEYIIIDLYEDGSGYGVMITECLIQSS